MPGIEYMRIVDELSEAAFAQCSELLFECFPYKVMKQREFRKVDLKEQLADFEDKERVIDKKTKADKSDTRYADEIKFYLKNYVQCAEHSRAEKYCKQAFEIIENVQKGTADTNDLEDLTKIYICLMRKSFGALKNGNTVMQDQFDHLLKRSDGSMLKEMKEFKFRFPQEAVEKGISSIIPKVGKSDTADLLARYKDEKSKYYLYIISVLFYCRSMQSQGEYAIEEGA